MAVRLLRGQTVNGVFYPAFDVLAGLGTDLEASLVQGGGASYVDVTVLAGEDAEAVRLHIAQTAGDRISPTWNGLTAGSIQFRGESDSAAALGTLGLVFNADTDGAAAALLTASSPNEASTINGASASGAWAMYELEADCATVHVGVLGMPAPMSLTNTSPVLQASKQFVRLDFALADHVRFVIVYESGPTDFAGTPGTGSARQVTVFGIEGAA